MLSSFHILYHVSFRLQFFPPVVMFSLRYRVSSGLKSFTRCNKFPSGYQVFFYISGYQVFFISLSRFFLSGYQVFFLSCYAFFFIRLPSFHQVSKFFLSGYQVFLSGYQDLYQVTNMFITPPSFFYQVNKSFIRLPSFFLSGYQVFFIR